MWVSSVRQGMVRIVSQSLRLQAYLQLARLGSCHKRGVCANYCARRSVCFCNWGVEVTPEILDGLRSRPYLAAASHCTLGL